MIGTDKGESLAKPAGFFTFQEEGWKQKEMQSHSPTFKHISAKHAETLYALSQEASEKAKARATATTTVNPILITLLFWFLPGFFLIHNFFIRYIWAGLLQLVTMLSILVAFNSLTAKRHLQTQLEMSGENVIDIIKSIDNTDITLKCLLVFLILWYLLDGVTVYQRTRSSNFRKVSKALRTK